LLREIKDPALSTFYCCCEPKNNNLRVRPSLHLRWHKYCANKGSYVIIIIAALKDSDSEVQRSAVCVDKTEDPHVLETIIKAMKTMTPK
jgi:hypothetical protein